MGTKFEEISAQLITRSSRHPVSSSLLCFKGKKISWSQTVTIVHIGWHTVREASSVDAPDYQSHWLRWCTYRQESLYHSPSQPQPTLITTLFNIYHSSLSPPYLFLFLSSLTYSMRSVSVTTNKDDFESPTYQTSLLLPILAYCAELLPRSHFWPQHALNNSQGTVSRRFIFTFCLDRILKCSNVHRALYLILRTKFERTPSNNMIFAPTGCTMWRPAKLNLWGLATWPIFEEFFRRESRIRKEPG